jgi:predicted small secreted protein
MQRLFIAITLSLGLAIGLSACNTIKGAGQDLKKAGESIENAAKK